MRAAVYSGAGGPEVIEIGDVPRPEFGPEQALVRVQASALNRADVLQRQGHYPAPPGAPRDIPGWSSPVWSRRSARASSD